MSEELEVLAETLEAAPELELTVDDQVTEETVEEQEEAKKFSQEELDRAISKRLAREQRKWEREQNQRTQERAPVAEVDPLQYETNEQYAMALAEKMLEQREQAKQNAELLETYHDREEDARAKYDDFEQVAYNPRLTVTDAMAQAIQAADNGPDIAYHLCINPKEAERIARLSPLLQAREIGKIEAKLDAAPPVIKQTTRAPQPINPVASRGSNAPAYDTTDPRSVKTMTTSEWIEAERQRQMKSWEAKRR
jgi:hypothetical protein